MSTTLLKETKNFGMPWESDYGYAQAVKVGDSIHISGQVSHDDQGNIVGQDDMELQMRQVYANAAKLLAEFDATMEDVVEETIFVTDMETAFSARSKLGVEVYGSSLAVSNTIVQIQRLAFPELLVEIKFVAKV